MCKVLEKQLQRQLLGFEEQEVRHHVRASVAAAAGEADALHRHPSSAPNLVAAGEGESQRVRLQKGETPLHNIHAGQDDGNTNDRDHSDDDDDDGDGDGDGDGGGKKTSLLLSDVKAQLWSAVSAGAPVSEASLTQWLQQAYSRPLSDRERAYVVAFVRQALAGAKRRAVRLQQPNTGPASSSSRSASEQSALVLDTHPSPRSARTARRPTLGDSVRVLPGHPRVRGRTLT